MNRLMSASPNRLLAVALFAASASGVPLIPFCYAASSGQQTQQPAAPGAASRHIGAIKAINAGVITLTPDSGPDVNVTTQATTRILRIAPGEKDLKNATPIQLQDLQIGDRILVAGKASDDNLSLVASTVVVMKHSDIEAHHQQDLQDWQKRGVGGLVSAVDPAAGTVTISLTTFSGKKNIVIHASSTVVIRRYAPDSVKFDDAKPATLQEIHPGDQVRARGDRNPDGTELAAEEIVSGSFRNVAGTVNSVDASSSTLSVQDLLSKKAVVIKITADSQLRKFPPEMAQRIAMRLKGATPGATPAAASSAAPSGGSTNGQTAPPAVPAGGTGTSGNGAGARPGGAPDFQQMLNRMPAVLLADLHKGDAVMIVSTEGTAGVGTAITLLSGVEPILQAAPTASSVAMLTPWSMSAPSGDAGGP
jgi:co-chaperonin GroES (HSP10)